MNMKNDYYIKHSIHEHHEYASSHKKEIFSKNELNMLISIFKFSFENTEVLYTDRYCGYINSNNCLKIMNHDYIWENLFIHKYSDEWYLAEFVLVGEYGERRNREYYLCDQFDGLIKCIEDLR